MNSGNIMLVVGVIIVLPLLVDVLSLIGLAWKIPAASREIYHKVCGNILVWPTDDLLVAMANGLIKAGDVLEVAVLPTENEGRFLIHPSIAGRPVGTMLKVVSIGPRHLALREIR